MTRSNRKKLIFPLLSLVIIFVCVAITIEQCNRIPNFVYDEEAITMFNTEKVRFEEISNYVLEKNPGASWYVHRNRI
jgi:hypothetical protein